MDEKQTALRLRESLSSALRTLRDAERKVKDAIIAVHEAFPEQEANRTENDLWSDLNPE